jgi:NAD+ kinase
VQVRLVDGSSTAQLSFDSHNFINLEGQNEINICKSKSMLELLHPLDHDFYDGCRNKLGWSSSITKP